MTCNLELRLSQPSSSSLDHFNPQQDQLTISYNGGICVCDVTEMQARAILWHASKQAQRRCNRLPISSASNSSPFSPEPVSPATLISSGSSSALSMKKSLQSFLLKRKRRQLSASPYRSVNR